MSTSKSLSVTPHRAEIMWSAIIVGQLESDQEHFKILPGTQNPFLQHYGAHRHNVRWPCLRQVNGTKKVIHTYWQLPRSQMLGYHGDDYEKHCLVGCDAV